MTLYPLSKTDFGTLLMRIPFHGEKSPGVAFLPNQRPCPVHVGKEKGMRQPSTVLLVTFSHCTPNKISRFSWMPAFQKFEQIRPEF